MFKADSQFDYQSIIQAWGIQNVNIKKALDEKSEAVTKFQEHFDNLKQLSKEKDQANETLSKLKFNLNKNLQKLNKTHNKSSELNKEVKALQNEISQLNRELQQKSNNFDKKMTDTDQELKTLYSQFEGETLINILTDLNTSLIAAQDIERQLQIEYEQLKCSNDVNPYERLTVLKEIHDDAPETGVLEEIERKLANKKRNIQYLSEEYNKKMKMLQSFE